MTHAPMNCRCDHQYGVRLISQLRPALNQNGAHGIGFPIPPGAVSRSENRAAGNVGPADDRVRIRLSFQLDSLRLVSKAGLRQTRFRDRPRHPNHRRTCPLPECRQGRSCPLSSALSWNRLRVHLHASAACACACGEIRLLPACQYPTLNSLDQKLNSLRQNQFAARRDRQPVPAWNFRRGREFQGPIVVDENAHGLHLNEILWERRKPELHQPRPVQNRRWLGERNAAECRHAQSAERQGASKNAVLKCGTAMLAVDSLLPRMANPMSLSPASLSPASGNRGSRHRKSGARACRCRDDRAPRLDLVRRARATLRAVAAHSTIWGAPILICSPIRRSRPNSSLPTRPSTSPGGNSNRQRRARLARSSLATNRTRSNLQILRKPNHQGRAAAQTRLTQLHPTTSLAPGTVLH